MYLFLMIYSLGTQKWPWDTSALSKGSQQFYHKEYIFIA